MNLIVTDFCNRTCPYCFAKSKVRTGEEDKASGRSISLQNVDLYLDFLERSHEKTFKILGGEPTLHPQLPEIIEHGLARGLHIELFTNGLWPQSFRDYCEKNVQADIVFIVNTNEPSLQSGWETDLQAECFTVAGERARISFNIYRNDFDLLFAGDLIDRFSLHRQIRIGIANPIVGKETAYIDTHSLKQAAKRLVHQLRRLEKRNILGSFDCGFTLCMFDEKELGSLALVSTGFSSVCGSAIDVGPELNAWPCFPLSEIMNINLLDYRTCEDVAAYYRGKTAPLRSFGSREECISCKYLKRGQCTGGCLARAINSWMKSGDPNIIGKLERAH